jgi:two-component sensor histidine kinase
MSRVGKRHLLVVSDNGSGKTKGNTEGTGFGMRLVGMLVQQLEGKLHETNDVGLRIEIRFTT